MNQDIEYKTDVPELMKHWYYDAADFKHTEGIRNQSLVETIGRRTKKDASNLRLTKRFTSTEQAIWKNMTMFEIDMSKIHSFFGINNLMWVPLQIKLYFNDDYRQLFEIRPTEDIDEANVYDTQYGIIWDESFPPQIILPLYEMSASYQQQDAELFKQNGVYDLGNYSKPSIPIQTIPKGADQITMDISGITERPEWLVIQVQSLTAKMHLSHYDSTHEDIAQNIIKRVVITGIETPSGTKEIDFEVNNANKKADQLMSYNALKRFTTNAPLFTTNSVLMGTDYMGNFVKKSDFQKGATDKSKGVFPLVFDLSDSKGNYDGSSDDNCYLSSQLQFNLYLNNDTEEQYNVVVTVITAGKYVLYMNDNGQPGIKKV